MRVLHVTHQYRPAIGGSERYIVDLSEELVRRGHQVDVFTSRSVDYHTWHNTLPCFEQLDGVNVYRFSSLGRGALAWRLLRYGFAHYWQARARRYEPFIFYGSGPLCLGMFLALLMRAQRYDLIHINQLHYSHSLTAFVAAHLRRIPIVVTPHLHTEQHETYDVGYMQSVMRGCHTILTDTRAEKEHLVRLNLNPEIIVGGISLRLERFPPLDQNDCRAKFGIPADAFVLLFLGRKTHYKGLDICLEAFESLHKQFPQAYFMALGPETDYSREFWPKYSRHVHLIVRGTVSDDVRLAALAACDVLVMPSVGEAFGIAYLEAWAYCKPVIGARIAAVSNLIQDGENGLLIEPGQAAQLAGCLAGLAADPARAREMGKRGRTTLEQRYTIERNTDTVEAAYHRTIRRAHNRRRLAPWSSYRRWK